MAVLALLAACSSGQGSSAKPPTASTSIASRTTAPGSFDFSLVDMTWVSTTEGWALGAQPCGQGFCSRIADTTNGAAFLWQMLPDPPAQVPGPGVDCSRVTCVSSLRFANPSVGYLFGPALLMTTDGGRSWRAQPGPLVETLTVAGDHVYRVSYDHGGCPGPCQPFLQEAAVGGSSWRTLIEPLTTPGRSSSAQIVGSGGVLITALYGSLAGPVSAQASVYRSGDGGVEWQTQPDPCGGRGPAGNAEEEDLVDLTTAPGGFFAGLCTPHGGAGAFLVTSNDGGLSWRATAPLPAGQEPALVAAASPTTLAVATGPTSVLSSWFAT